MSVLRSCSSAMRPEVGSRATFSVLVGDAQKVGDCATGSQCQSRCQRSVMATTVLSRSSATATTGLASHLLLPHSECCCCAFSRQERSRLLFEKCAENCQYLPEGLGNAARQQSRMTLTRRRRAPYRHARMLDQQLPISSLPRVRQSQRRQLRSNSRRTCSLDLLPLLHERSVTNRFENRFPSATWRPSVRRQWSTSVLRCSVATSATVLDGDDENTLQQETCEQKHEQGKEQAEDREQEKDSFLRVAGIVGTATMASKLLGTVRETALAAAFGIGPVMDAFSYASLAPSFFIALLGGINGPFHSAMTSSLSKRSRSEGAYLVGAVSTLVGLVFVGVSIIVAVFAEPIIDLSAPGLFTAHASNGLLTRNIAIFQLRIMAPCALLAPLIGIGFGSLSARKVYVIPSLSPSFSSLAILIAVGVHVARFGKLAGHPSNAMQGGITLAIGSTAGTILQWLVQVIAQARSGDGFFRLRFENPFVNPGVKEVLRVVVPAAVGSGLLQVATYTDLYFASFLPNAASALGYANLLAQAPLGILTSAILVPVLPLFAKFSKADRWPDLRQQVRQGLLLTAASTLLMTAILIPLARPIVRVLFERRAFDAAASDLVSSLFVCYVSGSIIYLSRDVLVRVFYALADGNPPFYTSMIAIAVNAILDWIAVRWLGYGVQGLVLATLSVNFLSVIILLGMLSRKLQGLDLANCVQPLCILTCVAASTAFVTRAVYDSTLRFSTLLAKREMSRRILPLVLELTSLGIAATSGLLVFFTIVLSLRLQDIESLLPRGLRRA